MSLLSAVLNSSFICPIWSDSTPKYAHDYTHKLTSLVKGGPVVLFHRGSRVVITDLHAYLIAHTHPRRNTHSQTSMYAHAHFHHPFPSAVMHDLDHTQTNRLVLQSKEVPTPHKHICNLANIITSNLQSTVGLAEISWGIFGCVTCSQLHKVTAYITELIFLSMCTVYSMGKCICVYFILPLW